VKPTITRRSTTATPAGRFAVGRATAIGAGLASSATAVTLPAAIHALGHRNMPLALAIGVAPALPLLLVIAAVTMMYVTASAAAVAVTIGRVIRGRTETAICVDELFRWIINAPIALLTLTPLKPMARTPSRTTSAVPALPAALGAARKQGTPVYWETLQEMMNRPGGAPDVVRREDDDTQPIRGRHARPGDERKSSGRQARQPEMTGSA
jgi:hypothetical protein